MRRPFLRACNFGGSTSSSLYGRTNPLNRSVSKNTQQHTWESIYMMFRTSHLFFLPLNRPSVFMNNWCGFEWSTTCRKAKSVTVCSWFLVEAREKKSRSSLYVPAKSLQVICTLSLLLTPAMIAGVNS